MKKLAFLASAALLAVACSQPAEKEGFSIDISIDKLPEGTIYLSRVSENQLVKIDSSEVSEGTAHFSGVLEGPEVLYLQGSIFQRPQTIFVYDESVTVTGTVDSLRDLTISGSPYQDQMKDFQEIEKNFSTIYGQFNPLMQQAAMDSNERLMDSLNAELETLYENFQNEQKSFAKTAGITGAYIAVRYMYEPDLEFYNAVYDQIPVNMSGSPYKDELKSRIEVLEKTAVGQPITTFTQNDPDGNPLAIADVKGKFILMDFWASWCGPCRMANPELVELYAEFHDKGFEIVGVSLDDNGDKWRAAIEQDGLTWPQMSDLRGWNNEAADMYGIRAIPQSVLYNEFGQIVAKNKTPGELREFLSENL